MRGTFPFIVFALLTAGLGTGCSGEKAARQIIREHRAEYQRCQGLLAAASGGMKTLEGQRGNHAAFDRTSSDVNRQLREASTCVTELQARLAQAMVAKGVSHAAYEKAWAVRDEIFAEAP
jgi:hypothetical protein